MSVLPSTADAVGLRFAPILLKKSFLADEQNFSGPLMRSAGGDVRDHIALWTFVSGLAAVKTSKHRLSRDFQRGSIFDFCHPSTVLRVHALAKC